MNILWISVTQQFIKLFMGGMLGKGNKNLRIVLNRQSNLQHITAVTNVSKFLKRMFFLKHVLEICLKLVQKIVSLVIMLITNRIHVFNP